jgi:hypothetical protein
MCLLRGNSDSTVSLEIYMGLSDGLFDGSVGPE